MNIILLKLNILFFLIWGCDLHTLRLTTLELKLSTERCARPTLKSVTTKGQMLVEWKKTTIGRNYDRFLQHPLYSFRININSIIDSSNLVMSSHGREKTDVTEDDLRSPLCTASLWLRHSKRCIKPLYCKYKLL